VRIFPVIKFQKRPLPVIEKAVVTFHIFSSMLGGQVSPGLFSLFRRAAAYHSVVACKFPLENLWLCLHGGSTRAAHPSATGPPPWMALAVYGPSR
jgi:hypothetical protein